MFFIYIMTNKPRGTLYTGQTDNLFERVNQHKQKIIAGFTKKYGLDQLVYFEALEMRDSALYREKQIKEWKRQWKINLIESLNPHWQDLASMLDNKACQSAEWTPAFAGEIGGV